MHNHVASLVVNYYRFLVANNKLDFSTLNSQLSILNSQFSIIHFVHDFCFARHSSSELDSALAYRKNSQFSILNSQFSIYLVPITSNPRPYTPIV